MKLMEWSESFESGNELIDHQHYDLMKNYNTYIIYKQFGMHEKAAEFFLTYLYHYVQYHFQAEEAFQKESNYPAFRQHEAAHEMITIRLKNLMLKYEAAKSAIDIQDEFSDFIYLIMHIHIINEDVPFCQYYKEYMKKTAN